MAYKRKRVKKKPIRKKGLTKRQEASMKRHAKHHTAKHMKAMIDDMLNGATFSESHKKAQKKVGAEEGMVFDKDKGKMMG